MSLSRTPRRSRRGALGLLGLLACAPAAGLAGDSDPLHARDARGARLVDLLHEGERCQLYRIRDWSTWQTLEYKVVAGPVPLVAEMSHSLAHSIAENSTQGIAKPAARMDADLLVRCQDGQDVAELLLSTVDGSIRLHYDGPPVYLPGSSSNPRSFQSMAQFSFQRAQNKP